MIHLFLLEGKRFLTYSLVGVTTFAFDLALLYVLVEYVHVPYVYAAGGAFAVAVTLNYILSRYNVFSATRESTMKSFIGFVAVVVFGSLITSLGVWTITTVTDTWYMYARVLVAGLVGCYTYIMNVLFVFKVGFVSHREK